MGWSAGGAPCALAMELCVATAVAAGVTASPPAWSQDDPAYPAATCAALWTAHARALGPGADPLGFREAAVRLSGDAAAVDAFIATQTLRLLDLIQASVDPADTESGALFEGLKAVCDAFAAEAPETGGTAPSG